MAKLRITLKSLLNDETYARLWRWLAGKIEGHRVVISLAISVVAVVIVSIWPE